MLSRALCSTREATKLQLYRDSSWPALFTGVSLLQVSVKCNLDEAFYKEQQCVRVGCAVWDYRAISLLQDQTEAIQALDQHLSYCCGGYSSVDIKRNKEDGQKCYNQQSIEEREKFDEETLVNLNNNNKTRIRSQSSDSFNDEETMNMWEQIFSRGVFAVECPVEILNLQFTLNDFDNI
ncbi:hypothetical protein TSUD_124090 [Trifolium subterraneum]|uniref:Uncharacterized protein n=1 Tax=Trifolium subterraneum TaxID=3900 RepID=A0A2Z6P6K3_TRISU|nr:hypothetical protein TSUD_124090 [Trifolium subterraneum]